MKTLSHAEILSAAVKSLGKYSVYIANHMDLLTDKEVDIWESVNDIIDGMYSHVPIFQDKVKLTILTSGLVLFDSVEARDRFFNIFNTPPVYSSGLYAQTFDADGTLVSENT